MPTLLVLLKYPTPGNVKTRLAATLGIEKAAALYRQWIELVFAEVQALRGSVRVVAYCDGAPLDCFAEWKQLADEWWSQPEGDLGRRLMIGFEKAHSASSPVVAIGTDCLELDSALLREAFARLEKYEVVFGPSPDGGYYLVGTSTSLPYFFDGVNWSSRDTLSSHVALCDRNRWAVSTLPERRDIDTMDDWRWHCSKEPLPSVAVVIPTLNEERALPATLAAACKQMDSSIRVLIADGGSTDGTKAIAEQFGVTVIETSSTGRGCQIAEVLPTLRDDVILILHADAILAPGAITRVRRWLEVHPLCPGGCLGHRFDSCRSFYRLLERWDYVRARLGVSYGDQAQFFRRRSIEQIGGFPDLPIMEDLELSRKLRTLGRPAYLDYPVLVSPRRLQRVGWLRSALTNFAFRWAYHLSGPAICWKLYQRYYATRGGDQCRPAEYDHENRLSVLSQ